MWIRRAHDIQSVMFTSSITFGLNQAPAERGVRTDAAARLPRIMGIYGGEKKTFAKVKLYRAGKLNRTICRIEIFFRKEKKHCMRGK